jgi:hypothetical protein
VERKCVALRKSGQALIITSLIITMLLLSTVYYVFETRKNIAEDETVIDSALSATKLSVFNTVVSGLSNFSNGGQRSALNDDFEKLASVIKDHFHGSECQVSFTCLNSTPYQEGVWLSWESDGTGISGAYVSFLINSSEPMITYDSGYEANVTTTLTIEGTYVTNGAERNVTVTCRVYNENHPALVDGVTLYYQNETDGPWMLVDSSKNLSMIDHGNGTYVVLFNVVEEGTLSVSAHAHDLRGIFVMANVTCGEV